MPTKTYTDEKENTKVRVQQQVGKFVREYLTAIDTVENKSWQLVIHFNEIRKLHKYTIPAVLEMYKKEVVKARNIRYRNEDKEFKSLVAIAYRVKLVVERLKQEEIDTYIKKGIAFTSIWLKLTSKEYNSDRAFKRAEKERNKKKFKEENSIEALRKEAKEGVVNAEVLTKAAIDLPKRKASKKTEPKSTTYAAPDLDKEWEKTSMSIMKNDIHKFAKTVLKGIERGHLLAEIWEGPAQQELAKPRE